jgi:hypothetical protein
MIIQIPTNNVSFLPVYETIILMKLDNIIEQNSEIINFADTTNRLISCFILGFFTIKIIKLYFKGF